MKTLLLLRHAKAEKEIFGQADFDRSLSKRGLRDAQHLGDKLLHLQKNIDLIVSSPALRTAQTAQIIAEGLQYPSAIEWDKKLYHASAKGIQDVILETDSTINTLLLVGHNNGISELAFDYFAGLSDYLPTCGLLALQIDTDNWQDIPQSEKRYLFTVFPERE
jgi:phosphohistidine phosphatase